MGLIDRIVEWATSGAKTDPGDSYREAGWQYRVRPPRQYWNFVENERDVRINQLIDAEASVRTLSPGADYNSVCEMLNPDWADPKTSRNYLSTGAAIKDSCLGWDHDNNKPILYVLSGNDIYPCEAPWDHSAAPSLGSALAISYTYTPTDVMGVCSDGDYLYVVYGVTGSYVRLSKFSLISFTGTDLWGGISTTLLYDSVPDSTACDFIVANSEYLGFLIGSITQPAYMEVFSILRTTGSYFKGYGNGTSSDYMSAKEARLVSDGLRMYWMVHTGTTTRQSILNSALISNPATSPYSRINVGGTYPSGSYNECKTGVAICRGIVMIGDQAGAVFSYTPGESAVDELFAVDNTLSGHLDTPIIMRSDGVNLWFFCMKYASSGGLSYGLYPIPSGLVTRVLADSSPVDVVKHGVFIDENTYSNGLKAGNLIFDGRDMWLVTESGDLFRICAPGLR